MLLLETLGAGKAEARRNFTSAINAVTRSDGRPDGAASLTNLVALQADLEGERRRREDAEKLAAEAVGGRATPTGTFPPPAPKLKDEIETAPDLPAPAYRSPKRHAGVRVLGAVGSQLPLSRFGGTELRTRSDAACVEEGSGSDRMVGATL